MPLNRNTLMRIRTIDACLQRRQRKWTIEDLRQACEDALYDYEGIDGVSLRTVQRDIELMRGDKLGYYAPIVVRNRKYYEYEDPDYSIMQKPLSKQDIAELSSAMDIIKHYQGFQGMKGQEDILARMQDQIQTQESHQQIVFLETNNRLKGLQFLSPLYDFIAKKEPIVVDYHSFKSSRDTRFYLSPYALCEFNNRWFLLAYSKKMKNIQTVALDRILAVSKDEAHEYQENTFCNMEEYLSEMVGITRDLHTKPERVLIRIDAENAPYAITKPLHQSQQTEKTEEDGSVIISLNVIINFELEHKILGFGSHMEVLSPRLLRHRVAQQMIVGATKYQK